VQLRSRRRGQSVVEFGIIAILFTLIMFAIVDFGVLLNDWLSVSSGVRQLTRDAAVGMSPANINLEAQKLSIPGVDPSTLQVQVTYYDQTGAQLASSALAFPYGSCPGACAHPSPPNASGPGDMVQVTLTAGGAQVITPLVRPFFTNSTTCTNTSPHCYIPLSSTLTMRFEGDTF
jgi:Flp pilus assembly protein TadG